LVGQVGDKGEDRLSDPGTERLGIPVRPGRTRRAGDRRRRSAL